MASAQMQIVVEIVVSLSPDTLPRRVSAWLRRWLDRRHPRHFTVLQPIVVHARGDEALEAIRRIEGAVRGMRARERVDGIPRVVTVDSAFEGEELG